MSTRSAPFLLEMEADVFRENCASFDLAQNVIVAGDQLVEVGTDVRRLWCQGSGGPWAGGSVATGAETNPGTRALSISIRIASFRAILVRGPRCTERGGGRPEDRPLGK